MRKMELYLNFINNRLQRHNNNNVTESSGAGDSSQLDGEIGGSEAKALHSIQSQWQKNDKVKRHLNQIKMRIERSLQLKKYKQVRD